MGLQGIKKAAEPRCTWLRGKCGALGADSSCLQPRCVSLSHCALLAPSSAEEALQHTQAVHHHHSPCVVCVCVRTHVCVLSQSLWGATNSQVTNKLTVATIALTPVPPLYPNKPGTSSAFFPSASERAAYISDAAHSHSKNFLYQKKCKVPISLKIIAVFSSTKD